MDDFSAIFSQKHCDTALKRVDAEIQYLEDKVREKRHIRLYLELVRLGRIHELTDDQHAEVIAFLTGIIP